jgi:hypothetical protein
MPKVIWDIGDIFTYDNQNSTGVVIEENVAVLIVPGDRVGPTVSRGGIPEDAYPARSINTVEHDAQMVIRGALMAINKSI